MAGSAAFAIVTLGLVMFLLDGWVIIEMRGLPRPVIAVFDEITDFGKSGWLLFPLGLFLIAIAAVAPLLPKSVALVAASLTVRVSFLFVAIAAPGVCTLMIKHLIGRARPYVSGGDAYVFNPFVSGSQYASFPSGHSTTAFAAAIAIGAIWPGARASLALRAYDRIKSRHRYCPFSKRRHRQCSCGRCRSIDSARPFCRAKAWIRHPVGRSRGRPPGTLLATH
jgi:membrane-associated phospholipid phosphatase